MRTIDFSPLFRSSVGFDHLARMLESANRVEGSSYPPYNIELLDEDQYRVSMAVAGFAEAEIDITVEQNTLTISGKKADDEGSRQYLHQGIATRGFERKFQLADHVKVVSARLENGLLHVELQREVPETMKPRKVAIQSGETLIENKTDEAA